MYTQGVTWCESVIKDQNLITQRNRRETGGELLNVHVFLPVGHRIIERFAVGIVIRSATVPSQPDQRSYISCHVTVSSCPAAFTLLPSRSPFHSTSTVSPPRLPSAFRPPPAPRLGPIPTLNSSRQRANTRYTHAPLVSCLTQKKGRTS